MKKRLDLLGEKFGMLTVEKFEGVNKKSQSVWLCKCDCGNTRKVPGYMLNAGQAFSCGCAHKPRKKETEKKKSCNHLFKPEPKIYVPKTNEQCFANPIIVVEGDRVVVDRVSEFLGLEAV